VPRFAGVVPRRQPPNQRMQPTTATGRTSDASYPPVAGSETLVSA